MQICQIDTEHYSSIFNDPEVTFPGLSGAKPIFHEISMTLKDLPGGVGTLTVRFG
jgi:hypothetical protein